ncbi:MAG: sugar phosphate isomerase/epimerase [Clostridia bacterium]|nr:sugar phosphate isomerase/epimerase [Clostridia bacterium]
MKLGVISDSFRRPMKESIEIAASIGLSGIQMYAVGGEICPDSLLGDKEKLNRYKKILRDNFMTVSALCGDLGGHGFERADDNVWKIEKTKRIIDLACEFETNVVTTHIGLIPDDETKEKYRIMLDGIGECGIYAASRGVTLAIETGPEIAPILLDFVKKTSGGVGVNLDPANFVMVTGQDPAEAVYLLKDYIVHTHLKDGKKLCEFSPEVLYSAPDGVEVRWGDYIMETPVGEGNVNFAEYFGALSDIGYNGYLTIEREVGDDPAADIKKAADYVRNNFSHILN